MNTNIVNLFYLKRAKPNKQGLVPIYHRTTINGKRIDKGTGKFVDPDKWSTEAGRMKGNSEEARSINKHLETLIAKNVDIEKKLVATEEAIDSQSFNAILSGKVEQRTIVNVFKEHNEKMKLLVPEEYSEGTLERYETSLSHTIEFMQWKYKVSDMPLNKIDYGFVSDYDFYLRSVRKCANNTTVKYLSNFNKIVKICLKHKWMKEDPFIFYEGKTREVDRDFLVEEEIQEIYQNTPQKIPTNNASGYNNNKYGLRPVSRVRLSQHNDCSILQDRTLLHLKNGLRAEKKAGASGKNEKYLVSIEEKRCVWFVSVIQGIDFPSLQKACK